MRGLSLILFSLVLGVGTADAEDPIFSGPQPTEKLPSLTVKGVHGDHAGEEFDPVQLANGKPVLIIFVHARTRPAFGLANAMMKYAALREKDGLTAVVVWLTSDATATEKWLKLVEKNLPKGVEIGYSPDGIEGPGAYGLNRNVTMTVLVGKENKVTANFALVQPGMQVDGPKILKAIVEAVGSGEVPTIASLAGERYREMQRPNARGNAAPNLRPWIGPLLNKEATTEEVDAAAKKLEQFVEKTPAAAKELGRITNTIIDAGKLKNYGTPAAQEYLKAWAKKYPHETKANPRELNKPEKKTEPRTER